MWGFPHISDQFFCKAAAALENKVCYLKKKKASGSERTVPGFGTGSYSACPTLCPGADASARDGCLPHNLASAPSSGLAATARLPDLQFL